MPGSISKAFLREDGATHLQNGKTSVGAKSQILSSVAPPRKKNLVTIFSQGHVLGPWKPMFY